MHFLLLFGIVLLPKAYSLKCYECMPSPHANPCKQVEKECLPAQQCSSINVGTSILAGAVVNVNMKTCAMAEQCYQGSINLGVTRVAYGSKCCNSELCNTMDVPAYSKNAPNGKKCYSCDQNECTTVTECKGEEDRCVSVSVTSPVAATVKGCITKNMCGQSADMLQNPGAELNCCEGDLCNSATSASAGLLLLMASLISMYMIS